MISATAVQGKSQRCFAALNMTRDHHIPDATPRRDSDTPLKAIVLTCGPENETDRRFVSRELTGERVVRDCGAEPGSRRRKYFSKAACRCW